MPRLFLVRRGEASARQGEGRTLVFRPGNCSRTVLDVDGGRRRVVELGDQGVTVVR